MYRSPYILMMISFIQNFGDAVNQQVLISCTQHLFNHGQTVEELESAFSDELGILDSLCRLKVEWAAKCVGKAQESVAEIQQSMVKAQKSVVKAQQKYEDALMALLRRSVVPETVRI